MNKLSEGIRENCCGTTCQKFDIAKRVEELEKRNADMQEEIDEYNRLRGNKEAFARKCFNAGMLAVEVRAGSTYCDIKHWLTFKATEL